MHNYFIIPYRGLSRINRILKGAQRKDMRLLLIFLGVLGLTHGYTNKTIVECLRDNGFSVLPKLINDAGLTATLSTAGPFTIFAPSDFAFSKLGLALMNSLANDYAQLRKVLEYHVVNGFLLVPMIQGTVSKQTIEGQSVIITNTPGQPLLFNNNSRLNGSGDIVCSNGVIQPIDTVLLPPVIDHLTIAQILLKRDDQFKDVFLAFLLADLTTILGKGDFTLFAPVDSAFAVYKNNLLRPGAANASYIYGEVLKYHIVPGERTSSVLQNGPVFTLHGTPVNITKTATGVKVNQANVIEADIGALNGVIHAIDSLLIPPEFISAKR